MDRNEAKEKALGKAEKAAGKREKGQVRRTNGSRALKQHLKYIVPQIRLVMVREPGPVPRVIKTPECLGPLMEPLRHYSDYVPRLNMCHSCRQDLLWLEERVFCDT